MRYYLISVKKAVTKKTNQTEQWAPPTLRWGCIPHWWECRLVETLWKTGWGIFAKTGNRPPLLSSKSITRFICKEIEVNMLKRHLNSHVYCSMIPYSQDGSTLGFLNGRRDKEMECLLFNPKNEMWSLAATWMELEDIILISQTQSLLIY